MTNYYEELKLDKNLSLNELRENLIRLESIWTDRASNRPEKAAEMLVLINQAKKVFATDMSRAAYDRELFAPPKEETAADPNAARKAEFEKWKKTAQDYYDRQEYDMAKTALDKALQNADEDDFAFLQLAAQICKSNGEYQVALSHINKALLIAPDLAELYITKALILEDLFIEESRRGFGDAAAHLQQARNTMRMASEKAATQGNKTAEAHADGYLAFLLYFDEPRTPLWRKGWREKPLKTATTGATPGGCWRIWRKNGRLPKRPHRRNGSAGRSWRGKNRSAGSGWHGKNGNAGKRQNVQSGKSEKRRLRSAGRSLQSSVCW